MASQPSILFLITPSAKTVSDNWRCIPAAFESQGWNVTRALHDDILQTDTLRLPDGKMLTSFDMVWPIGFGPSHTFADRCSLLSLLPRRKLITATHALQNRHAKNTWLKYGPRSLVSNQKRELINYAQNHGGQWVLKTNAGSFGNNVHFIDQADEIAGLLQHHDDRYWVLQRRIDSTAAEYCETRVLVCGDQIIGCYHRKAPSQGLANLSQQGTAVACTLSGEEQQLVTQIMADFAQLDIGFGSVDIAQGLLIETNIANPGGLTTLRQIYGEAAYSRACAKLVKGARAFCKFE